MRYAWKATSLVCGALLLAYSPIILAGEDLIILDDVVTGDAAVEATEEVAVAEAPEEREIPMRPQPKTVETYQARLVEVYGEQAREKVDPAVIGKLLHAIHLFNANQAPSVTTPAFGEILDQDQSGLLVPVATMYMVEVLLNQGLNKEAGDMLNALEPQYHARWFLGEEPRKTVPRTVAYLSGKPLPAPARPAAPVASLSPEAQPAPPPKAEIKRWGIELLSPRQNATLDPSQPIQLRWKYERRLRNDVDVNVKVTDVATGNIMYYTEAQPGPFTSLQLLADKTFLRPGGRYQWEVEVTPPGGTLENGLLSPVGVFVLNRGRLPSNDTIAPTAPPAEEKVPEPKRRWWWNRRRGNDDQDKPPAPTTSRRREENTEDDDKKKDGDDWDNTQTLDRGY